jgi:hypothetical protein
LSGFPLFAETISALAGLSLVMAIKRPELLDNATLSLLATLPRAASKLCAKTKQTIGARENKRSGGRGPDRTPRHRRTKREIGQGADFFKAQEN